MRAAAHLETMRDSSRASPIGVGLVCLLIFAAVVAPLGAPSGAAETPSAHPSANPGPDGDGSFAIGDGLEAANGTVAVVVRLEEVPVRAVENAADGEAVLAAHANESQDPLLTYADDEPGIRPVTTFWMTNAVLLEVDLDRVDLESFERFDNVTEVHSNVAVSVPEPPRVEASQDAFSGATANGSTTAGRATTPGLAKLNVTAVWDEHGARGEGVRVAVLDTGIDADHPDLELYTEDPSDPTYPGGWAEFDETGARVEGSRPHDDGVHGTHVSGTVAGGDESGTHIGVAPDVELLHGQVLSESTGGTFAQLVAGMEWAVANDADVLSMSLGAAGSHDAFVDPVRNAEAEGTVVVAAVGNGGPNTTNSPANVYDAVAVGAVDDDDQVAPFSGGGELDGANWTAPPSDWPDGYAVPDVVAPGWFVTSAVPGGGYEAYPGTSMATPHVAGTVALLLSVDPTLSPDEIETALYDTAWKPGAEPDRDPRYGHGIVDAKAAADVVAPAVLELWIPAPSESRASIALPVVAAIATMLGVAFAVAWRRGRSG